MIAFRVKLNQGFGVVFEDWIPDEGGIPAVSHFEAVMRFVNNVVAKPRAILLVVTVPLCVLGLHLLALIQRPPHLNQVVAELGSISRFMRDPVVNHAGTKLLFVKTTDNGYGVFLCDLASGQRKLIYEEMERGSGFGDLDESLLGWSPDDKLLAYSRHSDQWELAVCDGETGASVAVLPVDHFIPSAAWLTSKSFVFADSERTLYLSKPTNDQWSRPRVFKYFWDDSHKLANDQIENLARGDDSTVIWQQGGAWWKCGPDSEAPGQMTNYMSPDSKFTTATMDSGKANRDFTWYEQGYNVMAPATGVPVHGTTFTNISLPDHVYTMAPDYKVNDAVLIDSTFTNACLTLVSPAAFSKLSFLVAAGNGNPVIAYTVHYADGTTDTGSFVAPDWFSTASPAFVAHGRRSVSGSSFGDVDSPNPRMFSADVDLPHSASAITSIDLARGSGGGHAAIFAVSGSAGRNFSPLEVTGYNADLIVENSAGQRVVYAIKALNDEPAGIWKYDSTPDSPVCVVPNAEKKFKYARYCHIERGPATNAASDALTYYLLPPPHAKPGEKCPLVVGILGIGEMGFDWSANHEAIANCGAYFVSVDRNGRDYSQWAEDALTVGRALMGKLAIDTNAVYLYADSAGTWPVYSLLGDHPEVWRGAVLFSPGGFPEPAKVRGKRLFFDCGGGDGELAIRATNFQAQATQAGLPITLLVHPGLGHTFRVPRVERERMREALVFLGGQ